MRNTIFLIESNALSYCPICGEPLVYRDSCERGILLEGHKRRIYLIRRLKCQKCGKPHRELPDFLAPFKQYAAEIISGVLDGIIQSEDEDSIDSPCEETMSRWYHWLMANQRRIDGYLKSVGYRLLGFGEELLNSGMSLLTELRSSTPEWIETILRFIYNSGGFLVSA